VEFKTITPEVIKNNLLNLSQVVFEVTSACNFRCEYCSYGRLYVHDKAESYKNESLSFSDAKALIDYLASGWSSHMPHTPNQEVYISFFGGEPLLNMRLISKIVAYIESLHSLNRRFVYSMTTNGWLLDKYQEYLVKKDFHLLISLDGDKYSNSYRISAGGTQTYDKLIKNILYLRNNYPAYFEKRVLFNAVLHNRNSLSKVTQYFVDTFGKTPQVSPLASSNVNPKYLDDFNRMKQTAETFEKLDDKAKEALIKQQFFNIPIIHDIVRDYFLNSGNVFRSYNELVFGQDSRHFQTGTCTPFSKKVYLCTNGDILACERIPSKFSIGRIVGGKVYLNNEEIASRYNTWLGLLSKFCRSCARSTTCNQCVFQIDDFPNNTACSGYLTHEKYEELRKQYFSILGKHPELYKLIFENVILT